MEKDFKEAIDKSTKAMKELEEKVEAIAGDLSESASELWGDFKKNFADISSKLDGASENISKAGDETSLQAHLGAMEAREKVESMKEGLEKFASEVSKDAQATLDTAALKAHLAKMDAEDFWENKGKKITEDFEFSRENIEKMSVDAILEIGNFFEKLGINLTKKKEA